MYGEMNHVKICEGNPIEMNFSSSNNCPSGQKYSISIQRCDQWANEQEAVCGKFLDPSEISGYGGENNFDLRQYYNYFGKTFQAGNYYRITLAASQPWTAKMVVLHILSDDPQPPDPPWADNSTIIITE